MWPSNEEVAAVVAEQVRSEVFTRNYASVFDGDERWRELPVPDGNRYAGIRQHLRGAAALLLRARR